MTNAIFDLLRILDDAGIGTPVTGQTISDKLNISRTAVWKYVNILRETGYIIDASSKTGYSLQKRSWMLLPYEVRRYLKTDFIGREMHHFGEVPSTNALARQMMHEVGCEVQSGTVLIAEEQSGGSGRINRAWLSPEGGIWATIVLMPKTQVNTSFVIMAAVSTALAKAIRKECDLKALIRWPNEVFIGTKKVAGTTMELSTDGDRIRYCLAGIGVDANISVQKSMPTLTNMVTSLSDELGQNVDRSPLFATFLNEFERRYLMIMKGETEPVLREWKSLSDTLHHRVRIRTVHEGFDGEAMDIDEVGTLLVHRDNGDVEEVIAGDCIVLN
ncbi:MAG TPA: biotin--[acetyl-CoA-carboxylase] ligase [Methanocorpusculum sp.]|nr:biotin--[acetyl-CoA-carboxylase] ligase [Methanocorpusculum sp.]